MGAQVSNVRPGAPPSRGTVRFPKYGPPACACSAAMTLAESRLRCCYPEMGVREKLTPILELLCCIVYIHGVICRHAASSQPS